jgi:predicted transposase/invertase (TIGR01784 family)
MGRGGKDIDIKKKFLSKDWINHPDDKFFKAVFSVVENAIDYISKELPADVVNRLDFDTLKLEKESFIDEKLKDSFADLIYSVKLKKLKKLKNDKTIKISLLFEHKTKQSEDIYIQLLTYLLNFYKTKKKNKKLELIIPIIVYHGKKAWERKEFSEYFNLSEDANILKRFIPNFDYVLSDLPRYSDDELHKKGFSRAELEIALLLMKNKHNVNMLLANLSKYLELIKPLLEKDEDYVVTTFIYLINTTNIDYEIIAEEFKKVSSKGGNLMMTTAQRLINEGIERGMARGRQAGIHEESLKEIRCL